MTNSDLKIDPRLTRFFARLLTLAVTKGTLAAARSEISFENENGCEGIQPLTIVACVGEHSDDLQEFLESRASTVIPLKDLPPPIIDILLDDLLENGEPYVGY